MAFLVPPAHLHVRHTSVGRTCIVRAGKQTCIVRAGKQTKSCVHRTAGKHTSSGWPPLMSYSTALVTFRDEPAVDSSAGYMDVGGFGGFGDDGGYMQVQPAQAHAANQPPRGTDWGQVKATGLGLARMMR